MARPTHPLTIEHQPDPGLDYQGVDPQWTLFAHTRAQGGPLSAREQEQMQQVYGETNYRWRIRWQAGIHSNMRVIFHGRPMGITGVVNVDERNRWLDLFCVEDTGNGR